MKFRLDYDTGKLRPYGVIADCVLASVLAFIVASVLVLSGISPSFHISVLISHSFSMSCVTVAILVDKYQPFGSWFFKTGVIAVVGIGMGGILTYGVLSYFYGASAPFFSQRVFKTLSIGLGIAAVFTYFFYHRDRRFQILHQLDKTKLQKAIQEKALIESQLKMLQNQIEPHFLFNTLANTQALIFQQPEKASQLLNHLSDLLRQNLTKTRQDKIHINDEISFIKAYLSIQKIRLGERLNFTIEVSDTLPKNIYLPPLLVQPLIENAIAHGIGPKEEGGTVNIIFVGLNEQLFVLIQDNGVGFLAGPTKGNGIALNNVRNRLSSLYGNTGKLVIRENTLGGVTSELCLPLLKKPKLSASR